MSEAQAQSSKFCVDCEWIATSYMGVEHFKCLAKENVFSKTINLVTGEDKIDYLYDNCLNARDGECGKEGKWFKQRQFNEETKSWRAEVTSPKTAGKKQITLDMI